MSLQTGTHAVKFGVNYNYFTNLGLLNGNEHLRDAHVLRRSVGDPQQQQRPLSAGLPDARHRPAVAAGQHRHVADCASYDAQQFATWFQDDWRATSQPDAEPRRALRHRLQLLRPEDHAEQRDAAGARGDRQPVRRAAEDAVPGTSRRASASPTTCRATAGGCCAAATASTSTSTTHGGNGRTSSRQNKRPLNVLATLTNTAIGVGQLATYRFGDRSAAAAADRRATRCRSAPPASGWIRTSPIRAPTRRTSATPTSWRDSTSLSVDYTHVEGRNELRR